LQHLSALKDLGCTSLTILIGVADGSGKTTHQDDYGLLASEGVTKRVPTADGHKRLFAVMDGVCAQGFRRASCVQAMRSCSDAWILNANLWQCLFLSSLVCI
jgi:hypothetical protein